ncbi:MAG: hypothetical protein CO129_12390 [Ignavibacteriales bacterium CG_4_9_14_3_um_filter_34_10]|nr:MAG: hypothetical protein CO129_12390 [Ignavibacteriales bacterium CG_4_9_14_3_um_filter_34_10]
MFIKVITVLVLFSSIFVAQPKAIHFKVLQNFLPKSEIPHFVRQKPTGSTQSVMGMTTSFAEVAYNQTPDTANNSNPISVNIKLTDASLYPAMLMSFMMISDFETEDENGYEKTILVKDKYKGILKAESGEYKNLHLSFSVANKFLLEFEAEGTDSFELLQQFINDIDYEKLEIAKPE